MKTHKNCWWFNHCVQHYEPLPENCPDYIYDPEKDDERTANDIDRRGVDDTKVVESKE